MKTSLTIEELRSRIGKPIFVVETTKELKKKTAWYVVLKIHEFKVDNETRGYIEFTDYDYIDLEKIHFFRFFDTEVSATELKEILDAEKKTKKTGYESVESWEKYYFINSELNLAFTHFHESTAIDINKYKIGNHFINENLAENIARAERLRYQLRRFAALNGGIPSQKDWENVEIKKWYINYLYHIKVIQSPYTRQYKTFGQVYFKSEEACKKAIEIFKDELIWYFAEFQEQLY